MPHKRTYVTLAPGLPGRRRPGGARVAGRIGRMTDDPPARPRLRSGRGTLAGPGPAGGGRRSPGVIGETEIPVEALIEILGTLFESLFEWRKERAENGIGVQETVQPGGQQDAQPDSSPSRKGHAARSRAEPAAD